jgi:hypothetical protein
VCGLQPQALDCGVQGVRDPVAELQLLLESAWEESAMKKHKIPGSDVRRMVRAIGMPARRHKCELCSTIFECHICTLGDEHDIHGKRKDTDMSEPVFVCDDCILENDLYVVTVRDTQPLCDTRQVDGQPRRVNATGRNKSVRFYDHLTGRLI